MEYQDDEYFDKEFIKIVSDSGYSISNVDFVQEILENLYEYMSDKTGIPKNELSFYMTIVTRLLGVEHIETLDIDAMCEWILWVRSEGLESELEE